MEENVVLAKTAGFCFGVKRAVDKVYECIESGRKIFTLGPIIHNKEVVKDLENKGVVTLSDISELSLVKDGLLIIRSHGVSENVIKLLEKENIEYIDMTCPFVKRIHDTVKKESSNKKIIIAGNKEHPEVVGICGWSNTAPTVIETIEEASAFEALKDAEYCLVSQTTFNFNKFKDFVEILEKKRYNVNVVNTICDATQKRQQEARQIASQVDIMIVIGDKASSNSRKLYDICSDECKNTFFIQTLDELKGDEAFQTKGISLIGITAGASTPNNIIEEVQKYVRSKF